MSLDKDDYGRIDKFLFNDGELFNGWMRGDYNSEKICEILSRELRIEYKTLWDALLADCRAMRVLADDLRKIGLLRKDYTTAIVTVNMDCFDRFIVPALGLDKYFDCIINSCNEGVFKYRDDDKGNKGGLLEVALSRTGADVNKSILIDDSEKACAEFEKLGGRALMVGGSEGLGCRLDSLLTNQ